MSDFYARFGKVLRYAADQSQLADLLRQIDESPEHQHTPDSAVRLIAADALDENGRSQEAHWLRQRRPVGG